MKMDNTVEEAVKSLQHYMATYNKQLGYKDYVTTTYIDDVLYGLARSLSPKYEFANGFSQFKKDLSEYLVRGK